MIEWEERIVEWEDIRELELMMPNASNIFYLNTKVKQIMNLLKKKRMVLDGEPYITWDRFDSMSDSEKRFYHDKLCDLVELI